MFEQVLELIKKYDRIIIHRHNNPDGDAIGCQVGLKHILKDSFPEKEIYTLLLERYNLEPEQTMFIDDRKQNVEAAAEVGIVPFHFDRCNPEKSCEQLRCILLK